MIELKIGAIVSDLFNKYIDIQSDNEIEIRFDDETVQVEEVLIPTKIFSKILTNIIAFEVKNKGLEYAGILTGLRVGDVIIVTGAYPAKKINASHVGYTIPQDELIKIDQEEKETTSADSLACIICIQALESSFLQGI